MPTPSSSITRGESPHKDHLDKADSLEMHDLEKQRSASDKVTSSDAAPATNPSDPPKLKFIPFIGRRKPQDPYPSLDEAPVLPMRKANLFSQWTYWWIQPLLITGYQRTLQTTDLWKLDEDMEVGRLADKLLENFERRRKVIDEWNDALDNGTYKPSMMRKAWWKVRGKDGRRKVGLAWALSDTFFYEFWSAGFIKVVGDVASVTSPLVTRALISFSTAAYYSHRGVPGYTAEPIGKGIGLCFVLWVMNLITSLSIHQYFVRSAGTGVLARGALIAAIYRRAMVLSGKSRTKITNGKLVNHIGTDVSRIDFCAGFFHMSWTASIQLIIIIVILLVYMGPSCLAGIGFLILAIPPQSWAMKRMFAARKKTMIWTDARAKLIQELLGGMTILKFFAWESPYLAKINNMRRKEMHNIRSLLIMRAGTGAVAMSMPALATVFAFVAYSGTGHAQDPTVIFTSLTLFNLLRMPLMMLPMSLGTITDAYNALGRLTEVFVAETRPIEYVMEASSDFAVKVTDADFQWEGTPPEEAIPKSKKQLATQAKANKKAEKAAGQLVQKNKTNPSDTLGEKATATDKEVEVQEGGLQAPAPNDDSPGTPAEQELMQLSGINLTIPRGQLCAVVGPVGAGKSSFLQALIGEMKRTRGTVEFGGSIAYAAQVAWMQSCSVRDNILFGQPFDEERYQRAISDACLEADLEMLPYGDATEIGEKGVTLSGGQKQRVNIARALYYDADIVLLDDPLSAVDAHVGKALFDNAICGSLKDKTRILVTHALHFLPRVDWIITIDNGRVIQEGTYADLIADTNGPFSAMMKEFGGAEQQEEKEEEKAVEAIEKVDVPTGAPKEKKVARGLMQEEERAQGAVGLAVYGRFLRAGKGHITVPLLILSLAWAQAATVLGSYWLVWWNADKFNQSGGFYEGMYALLGVMQAVGSFAMGLASVFIGFNASRSLHDNAVNGVMRAPMSFFNTTPIGRIMNRFSKDIDTIDNTLNDSIRMAVATFAGVIGAIILIAIVIPYFVIIVIVILALYFMAGNFYRVSAREIKRLDNILRSSVYAHFGESLSGMATIRAYGESENFLAKNEEFLDLENRAYYLTIFNQRWLGFRLDFFGAFLTLIVAIFGVGVRTSINPSQTGLILSTVLSIQQAMSWMVRQAAEVENDMNSVERIFHYGHELEQEAPEVIDDARPPQDWPARGAINFNNVVMSYRPELPPVLKGLNLSIKAGEKIGVVGRTGAGKSSIMQALFRMVELTSGNIEIDGLDIANMGLKDLRSNVGIIPQDALLFEGTLRSNLDPFGEHDDARLWDALKRAWLVDQDSTSTDNSPTTRFTLDLAIEGEGNNLSVGQRSLVSLARALVEDARVLVLDEATASVDLSTDGKIQGTIRDEFKEKTLLIIAHRLRTIIDTDRVLVMADGQVAEFDTPINLYRQGGVFASMCERSGISEQDITRGSGF